MTLIIAAVNRTQAIVVSDRRLTTPSGDVVADPYAGPDDSQKAAVFNCVDVRAGAAFTGIASVGSLTSRWLLEALSEAAPPDFMFSTTLERLEAIAADAVATLKIDAATRRLSVLFAGYRYVDPALPLLARVSNYETGAEEAPSASSSFHTEYWTGQSDAEKASAVLSAGMSHAVPDEAYLGLLSMLQADKPPRAIVDRVVGMIRKAAESSEARGLIGHNCMATIISADPSVDSEGEYHSKGTSARHYMPSTVTTRPDVSFITTGAFIEGRSAGKAVPLIPKVGRNARCPCGSGVKYKKCHGR